MELLSRRQFTQAGMGSFLAASASGCGTLLFPERRGQPAGPLDWRIVALDAVGLLFFFVPGVIAFAVDFATGTIYLPPNQYGHSSTGKRGPQLVSVKKEKGRLTAGELEDVVSTHVGREVRLRPGDYKTRPLEQLDDFWGMHDEMQATDQTLPSQ